MFGKLIVAMLIFKINLLLINLRNKDVVGSYFYTSHLSSYIKGSYFLTGYVCREEYIRDIKFNKNYFCSKIAN